MRNYVSNIFEMDGLALNSVNNDLHTAIQRTLETGEKTKVSVTFEITSNSSSKSVSVKCTSKPVFTGSEPYKLSLFVESEDEETVNYVQATEQAEGQLDIEGNEVTPNVLAIEATIIEKSTEDVAITPAEDSTEEQPYQDGYKATYVIADEPVVDSDGLVDALESEASDYEAEEEYSEDENSLF